MLWRSTGFAFVGRILRRRVGNLLGLTGMYVGVVFSLSLCTAEDVADRASDYGHNQNGAASPLKPPLRYPSVPKLADGLRARRQ